MKIRISGTKEELPKAEKKIKKLFNVLESSKPYRNRGKSQIYRQYLEVA